MSNKQNDSRRPLGKMAQAFCKALEECNAEGRNPRRVGRQILTTKAAIETGRARTYRPMPAKHYKAAPAVMVQA